MKDMYYLRKEPYEVIIPEIKKTDGTVIPERKILTDDRAIYKADDCERFYRQNFTGMYNLDRMYLYFCEDLERILELRQSTFDYCGEWFDVYDENGKVNV
jgi:hypothetical protein